MHRAEPSCSAAPLLAPPTPPPVQCYVHGSLSLGALVHIDRTLQNAYVLALCMPNEGEGRVRRVERKEGGRGEIWSFFYFVLT